MGSDHDGVESSTIAASRIDLAFRTEIDCIRVAAGRRSRPVSAQPGEYFFRAGGL
jgi:hypothetical protein